MFERALVPLDGSRASEAALPAATMLAAAFGSTLILAHILEAHPPRKVHGEPHLVEADSALAYLSRIAEGLEAEGRRVETHVHEGPGGAGEKAVAGSIAAHSGELGFDLAVMAAHGKRGALDWLSASLPLAVAASGCFAVYLAKRGAAGLGARPSPAPALRGPKPSTILLPLDGKPEHETALPQALALAKSLALPLELLSVVPRRGADSGGSGASFARFSPALSGAAYEYAAEGAQAYLEALAARLSSEGVTVTWRLERGRPVRRIVKRAGATDALLVLSTHRRLGLDAALEGCVAFQAATSYGGDSLVVPVAGCL